MNIAIIYATFTGHSRKIANALAKELQVKAENVKNQPKLNNIDILFIVSGIYGGQTLPVLIDYVKTIDFKMVRKVALITSCASKNTKQTIIRETLENNQIKVLTNEFICQGNFLFFGLGHPNKTDIKNAISFTKEVIEDNKDKI